MERFKRIVMLMIVVSLFTLIAACGQTDSEQSKVQIAEKDAKPITLTVSAAASLKAAMEEIKEIYTKEKSNVSIAFNFGSSGALQQQIEQGAEVDVFISAATKQMDVLKDKGLIINDTSKNFLENNVVLVVPKDSSVVTDFKDLTSDKVNKIGLGEPKSVPAGQYAEEVLIKLGILDSIKSKAVYGNDVKEVLTWVETGNADAGLVYETDTKISDKVKIVAKAPEGSHKPVYYPAAVIKDSKNVKDAKDFIDFLYGSKAKTVFEKYGFVFLEK